MQRNVSVIVSHYHSLEYLQKVLWGYCTQTYRNFELIIVVSSKAENGVLTLIDEIKKIAFYPIQLVVSELELPMKALNNVVNTDYLVFTQAHVIPRQDFIAKHLQYREQGYWLQGTVDSIPKSVFTGIAKESIFTGSAFENRWLKKKGARLSSLNDPLYNWGWKAALWAALNFSKPQLNLSNVSFWKSDLRFLEVENQLELQRHLASLKKLKVKNLAYRTTALTLKHSV